MSKKSRFTKDMNDFQRYMFGRNGWNVQLGGWIKYLTDCTNYCIVLDMPWGERVTIIPCPSFPNKCFIRSNDKQCPYPYTFAQLRHRFSRYSKKKY